MKKIKKLDELKKAVEIVVAAAVESDGLFSLLTIEYISESFTAKTKACYIYID